MGEIDDEKEANMNLKEVGLEEILEAQSRQLAEKEEQDSLSTCPSHVVTNSVTLYLGKKSQKGAAWISLVRLLVKLTNFLVLIAKILQKIKVFSLANFQTFFKKTCTNNPTSEIQFAPFSTILTLCTKKTKVR